MAPTPSADPRLTTDEVEQLLDVADRSIVEGLAGDAPTLPSLEVLPPSLHARRGVFVTLSVDGRLNGCIGSIEATEPLAHGAARHAWSAAFADPRLPRLRHVDREQLTIELSVLSKLTPVPAWSRRDLVDRLRPGIDGLLIVSGTRQGVFLPSVWDQVHEPGAFVDHLRLKAGLRLDSWPTRLRAWRFTATKHARHVGPGSRAA